MRTPSAFFIPDGDGPAGHAFASTVHTAGPWDPGSQHGGPPSALLAHVLDADHPRPDLRTVRLTVEIRRPVPVARLHVTTEVLRGGKKVELLGATMTDDDGTVLLTAQAWRIRTAEIPLPKPFTTEALADPDQAKASRSFFRPIEHGGYVDAMEVRFLSGGWGNPGPAVAWMRQRHPLVEGHDPSPLERVMICADSGNGLSASFEGLFINPDLTVYLHRHPVGEWIGLEAVTTLTDDGIGLATTELHDTAGPVGRGAQSLLLDVTNG